MKVENKILAFFFNTFDFPIRFVYTQLGPISVLLNKGMFWKLYSSDFRDLDKKFEETYQLLEKNKVEIKDKIILELGPGNSYINAYNFLLKGAKKVILVDKFPRNFNSKKQKQFFNQELDFIKEKYNKKNLFFVKNENLDSKYIEIIKGELSNIDSKQKVDLIFSISVLEHIKDINSNIKSMYNILRSGGFMYHKIDLRDHYNFNSPFLFYKYSERTWNKYLTREGLSYTNRVRYDEFLDLFKRDKFKVKYINSIKYIGKESLFSNEFKNRLDLKIGKMSLILKK